MELLDSSGEESQEADNHSPKKILQILYDDYFDCLVMMQEDSVKIITINGGKIIN